jgi:hypothetical protein
MDKSMLAGSMLLTSLALIAGGAVSGLLGYGTYGYYRDKGMSSWKAGALTGAVGGALTAAVLAAGLIPMGMVVSDQVNSQTDYAPTAVSGLNQYRNTALYAALPVMVRR